jgi:beta-glucosidase
VPLVPPQEDVDLLKSLNFDAYRFSISWSRIFPGAQNLALSYTVCLSCFCVCFTDAFCFRSDGEGTVNKEGVAYYNNLIDYVLKKGRISKYQTE